MWLKGRAGWRSLIFTVLAGIGAANLVCVGKRIAPPPIFVEQAPVTDEVTRAEKRFQRVRAAAQNRGLSGRIGYVEGTSGGDTSVFLGSSFLAQFVLLPLVLDPDLQHRRWAIANFPSSAIPSLPEGWRVAEDCGGGVLLLARDAP